jgi:hypothetical protein
MRLGFNLSIDDKSVDAVKSEIDQYASISTDAIELSLTRLNRIVEFPFEQIIKNLRQFKYFSIHLPVISLDSSNNKTFLTYPNQYVSQELTIIKNISQEINTQTFVIHPDQVTNFNWANDEFGNKLGFENMDLPKKFGKNISDMTEVFSQCPQAKWIFDLNHLYTNDITMQSASNFFNTFKPRLTHYHISAFGGFHSSFSRNLSELVILKGVVDKTYPMIHEGIDYNQDNLKEEYNLIKSEIFTK